MSELERWLALQIAGVYHQSVHSALNCAPMEAWLQALPRRSRSPRFPRNLSRVYLQDENGVYWPIPYRDLRFPPISLWEHREAMKRIRMKGRNAVDEKLLFDSILGQREILKESRKTLRQRRESEKLRQASSRSLPAQAGTDSTEQDYSHLPPSAKAIGTMGAENAQTDFEFDRRSHGSSLSPAGKRCYARDQDRYRVHSNGNLN
jgi:hypothetical protein